MTTTTWAKKFQTGHRMTIAIEDGEPILDIDEGNLIPLVFSRTTRLNADAVLEWLASTSAEIANHLGRPQAYAVVAGAAVRCHLVAPGGAVCTISPREFQEEGGLGVDLS